MQHHKGDFIKFKSTKNLSNMRGCEELSLENILNGPSPCFKDLSNSDLSYTPLIKWVPVLLPKCKLLRLG